MKSSDIITIVLMSILGSVVAFFVVNALLGDLDEKSVTFDVPVPVTTELADPDPEIFNLEAINPTVEVYVGNCKDDDHDGILSEAEIEECGESDLITDNLNNDK